MSRLWRDYLWLVLSLGKIQEKFRENLGRDRTTQYHLGNFWMVLKWTKIQNFWYKISNSGIPVSFWGMIWDGKWPVLNGRELDRMGSGWTWMLEMANFPIFLGENLVLGNGIREPRPLVTSQSMSNHCIFLWSTSRGCTFTFHHAPGTIGLFV